MAGLIAHGSDPAAVMNAIRAMPSHLRGLNQGQYTDLKSLTDGTSQTALGHASTDGIIAELFGKGLTSQADVQAWYDEQTPNQMNKNTYQAIYQANQPSLNSIYNTSGFDPRIATQQYNAAVQKVGGTPYAGPPTAGTPAPYKQRFGGLQA